MCNKNQGMYLHNKNKLRDKPIAQSNLANTVHRHKFIDGKIFPFATSTALQSESESSVHALASTAPRAGNGSELQSLLDDKDHIPSSNETMPKQSTCEQQKIYGRGRIAMQAQ